MFNFFNRSFYFVALFLISATVALAQPKDNSPLSRIGLGNPADQFFAAQSGMAGLGAAYHDPNHINILNPASYSHLERAAFEIGVFSKFGAFKDESSKDKFNAWGGNLSYISLGFPLKNAINEVLDQKKLKVRWGMNFTLLPYSNVDYDIETRDELLYADSTTTLDFIFQGSGGTYKILWGNSFRTKRLSGGVNIGYFFGQIKNDKVVLFSDLFASFDNVFLDDYNVNGFVWNAGVQYDFVLKENDNEVPTEYVTAGLYGNSKNNYTLTRNREWRTENPQYNGVTDTVISVSGSNRTETKTSLPAEIGLGVMYVKKNKSRFGLDVRSQTWNDFISDISNADITASENRTAIKIAVGGEITPDAFSYNNYLSKVRYRFGAYYSSDPRTINDEQYLKYGLTAGMGFPIILPRQGKSFVNLGLEFGKQGITNSLQENFFKINLGFTLNDDTWFFKRKFN